MSARFYVGQSPGGHALRVMKDAADNPATTPRTDYEKFAFDSESGNLAYAHGVGSPPDINALDYAPIVTTMVRLEPDWWSIFGGGYRQRRQASGVDWNVFDTMATGHVYRNLTTGEQEIRTEFGNVQGWNYGTRPAILESRSLAWRLPGDDSLNPYPSGIGSIERFYKSGNAVRLPRPGHPIDDPNVDNFILHEDLAPAKLIRTGRMVIPASQTVDIQIPPECGEGLVVGGTVSREASTAAFIPSDLSLTDEDRNVQVRFMGGGVIRFREKSGRPTRVSYFIVAEDSSTPSTGSGSFLRSYGSGNDAYVQMCRPGSGDPPRLSDIMLDSRWGVMTLIKEGFVPKSSFSGSVPNAVVNYPDQGYIPLVLTSWYMSDFAGGIYTYPGRWAQVLILDAGYPGPIMGTLAYTSYTIIEPDKLIFRHLFGVSAAGIVTSMGQPRALPSDFLLSAFMGVRYWIFAVPQDLA